MRLCYQVLLFVGIILISESVPLTSYSKVSSSHVSSINHPGCNVTVQSGQGLTGRNFDVPVPPTRPPFCHASRTATYTFDDCKVTNNKLYIRNQFIRELTPHDQGQLRRFEEELANFSARTRAEYFNSLTTPGYNYPYNRATPSTQIQLPEAPSFCTASNRPY